MLMVFPLLFAVVASSIFPPRSAMGCRCHDYFLVVGRDFPISFLRLRFGIGGFYQEDTLSAVLAEVLALCRLVSHRNYR